MSKDCGAKEEGEERDGRGEVLHETLVLVLVWVRWGAFLFPFKGPVALL